jgi:hypothetical protein
MCVCRVPYCLIKARNESPRRTSMNSCSGSVPRLHCPNLLPTRKPHAQLLARPVSTVSTLDVQYPLLGDFADSLSALVGQGCKTPPPCSIFDDVVLHILEPNDNDWNVPLDPVTQQHELITSTVVGVLSDYYTLSTALQLLRDLFR